MQQFIEANWLTLVSILIGVLVAFFFYRLQKKDSISAAQERKKHATSELLDVVESYIINKQELSEHVVDNLVAASERDHQVPLRVTCSPVSLLQDVALRLQRSRHLDIPQKSEYSLKIDALIRHIRESQDVPALEQLSKDFRGNIALVQSLVSEDKQAEAKKALDAITRLSEKKRDLSTKRAEEESVWQFIAPLIAGLASVLATTTIGTKYLTDNLSSVATSVIGKVLPLFGFLLIALLALAVMIIVLRIRKREREGQSDGGSPDA